MGCLARPPRLTTTRAQHEEISGLNRTAFDLAVYASQGWSPTHHARLASGCWSRLYRTGLVTRRVPSERFQASDYPPFPSFLAQCRFIFSGKNDELTPDFRISRPGATRPGTPGVAGYDGWIGDRPEHHQTLVGGRVALFPFGFRSLM